MNNRGSAGVEYAVICLLSTMIVFSTVVDVSDIVSTRMFSRPGGEADLGTQGSADGSAATAPSDCIDLGSSDDVVSYELGTDCYVLGAGDDTFDGQLATTDLRVSALLGPVGRGSITTGSGADVVTSAQGGDISTGAGDDRISLILGDGSALRSSRISAGDGDDTIHFEAADGIESELYTIDTGGGRDHVTFSCVDRQVNFDLSWTQWANISGPCGANLVRPIQSQATDLTIDNSGPFSLWVEGSSGFSAKVSTDDPVGETTQSVDINGPRELRLTIESKTLAGVSYNIRGPRYGFLEGSSVDLNIEASGGSINFLDDFRSTWTAAAELNGEGSLGLRFPMSPDAFAAVSVPNLSGNVAEMRVGGCFAYAAVQTAQVTLVSSTDLCRAGSVLDFDLTSDEPLWLSVMNDDRYHTIPLRTVDGSLMVSRIIVGDILNPKY